MQGVVDFLLLDILTTCVEGRMSVMLLLSVLLLSHFQLSRCGSPRSDVIDQNYSPVSFKDVRFGCGAAASFRRRPCAGYTA